jgi:acyl-CoA thioesterase
MTTTGDVRQASLSASLRAEELLPIILDLERVFGGQVAGQALVSARRRIVR